MAAFENKQDILTLAESLIPDNTSEEISPKDIRTVLSVMMDVMFREFDAVDGRFDGLEVAGAIGYPIYVDTAAGLAATNDGDNFSVSNGTTLTLYQNVSNTASVVGTIPLNISTEPVELYALFLGTKAADPIADNDGQALVEGAFYWNTVDKRIRRWTGSEWQQDKPFEKPSKQKILCFSDMQPDANPDVGSLDQVQKWRDVIAGMNNYHGDADFAIIAGDIVDRGYPSDAEIATNVNPWYSFDDAWADLSTLNCGLQNLYVIPGNHDVDYREIATSGRGRSYYEFWNRFQRTFYHVVRGNVLYIYMGDMFTGTPGVITDYVFDWWEKLVLAHQNYVIITVTHQSLDGTIDADNTDTDYRIVNSARFISAMTRANNPAKVDAWISGHHGTSRLVQPDQRHIVTHNGCIFVNAGMHIPSVLEADPARHVLYRILELEDGSDSITFKSWDHDDEIFVLANEVSHTVRAEVQLTIGVAFDGRYHYDSKFSILDGAQTAVVDIEVPDSGVGEDNSQQQPKTIWAFTGILRDAFSLNLLKGWATGFAAKIPGGTNANPDGNDTGFAGGLWFKKFVNEDDDYSASAVLGGSGPASTEDSLVPSIECHPDGSLQLLVGQKNDYVSSWVEIDATTAPSSGTLFQHDLNLSAPFIMDVEVYFRATANGRVYDWVKSSPVASDVSGDRFDGNVGFQDKDNIVIGVGNDGVFAADNQEGGNTVQYTSGYFLVVANKKFGLPA